jgi:hypothetical protein
MDRAGGYWHPGRLGGQTRSPGDLGVAGIAGCRVRHQYQVRSVLGNSALYSRGEIRHLAVVESAIGVVSNRDRRDAQQPGSELQLPGPDGL